MKALAGFGEVYRLCDLGAGLGDFASEELLQRLGSSFRDFWQVRCQLLQNVFGFAAFQPLIYLDIKSEPLAAPEMLFFDAAQNDTGWSVAVAEYKDGSGSARCALKILLEREMTPCCFKSFACKHADMLVRKLPIGVTKGTLIDLETTGLDPETAEILTVGVVSGNKLQVLQRKDRDKLVFYRKVVPLIKSLPSPFYAFNSKFEREFLRHQLNIDVVDIDLHKHWRKRADALGLKWPKLDELIPHPETYFRETIVTGGDIPILWNKYLADKNEKHLAEIVRHNEIDLLRELMLLVHYPA